MQLVVAKSRSPTQISGCVDVQFMHSSKCEGSAHILESSMSSDPVIHNQDHAVDIELYTCVILAVYAQQQRRGNLNVSQYNEKITLITLISFRFNEISPQDIFGLKNDKQEADV